MAGMVSTRPDQKLIRIFRLRVTDKPGFLGQIATLLGNMHANIGEITIVAQGPDFIIREISLQLDDDQHLRDVEKGLRDLDGISIESIIDPVQQVHEGGKIAVRSRFPLETIAEMRKIYTPGVAQICRLIQKDISLARRYTTIGNSVAVVTNGTAILGLGNIGPVAGMPVMEGKSVLFGELVGINAYPILIDSQDSEVIIKTVKAIAPTFGAIQLEDIAAPECFDIEERLQRELSIPVLHDDQHGTAVVVLAALLTITRRMLPTLADSVVGIVGLGAAGTGIAKLLLAYGVKEIIGCDLRDEAMDRLESAGGKRATLDGVMEKSDVVVLTTGRPGLVPAEKVQKGQVILALSNPDPEIHPDVAIAQGARFAADGRTINNALAFPGLFRGALRAGAQIFTDEMKIAAAKSISQLAKEDTLVPSILDRSVHQHVADAVERAWLRHYRD